MLEALNSDFDEIRSGCVMATQCAGIGWHNINMELEKRCAPLYQDAFPCKFKSMPMVNPGTLMSMILKLMKLFLKKKLAQRIVLCSTEDLYEKHGYDRGEFEICPPL
jgi:hypothetical protein